MFIKLEEMHIPQLAAYVSSCGDETIYLLKPLELLKNQEAQGVFYGYMEEDTLIGVFYFSAKRVMSLHCKNPRILGNLDLLKAIKFHKPKFVKGTSPMVDGIYKLICRTVSSTSESMATLMGFESDHLSIKASNEIDLVTGSNKLVDELLNDLKFFIDVETHFGRQVKAINDIVKEFKELIAQDNYLLGVIGHEIVAQGMIEDETEHMGILSGIYVSPKYRKRGFGEVISSELTKILLERHKKPYLFVKDNNPNARALYDRIGYKVIKSYKLLTIEY
ncbi:GNAT family N-acetyltransferase [Fusibacter bizertensis]|jgi:Predicted acetyltransferase|uniref:GNAT family N-acetyltransferase n=1 Tax=Fusibacter bizertensis TaxID=1488331 RepID=A0ABT6NET4_9FIRM|nr:GNAT family N-acetyltransferase [Fusibacter bizertensis]MDH8678912.1 GNAT family N-acetyltransferase [Fusibacter bizertensis]